ncbi:MAG: hypothetical protein ACR2O2_10335, partial [Ruegeria sp.]
CKELFSNLTKVRETGIGVLMVEQNAKQSLAIADRGYLIENGSITGHNDAQSMLSDPAVQAAYLGGAAATTAAAVATAVVAATTTASTNYAPTAEPKSASDDGSDGSAKKFISVGGLSNSDLAPVSSDSIASMVAKAAKSSQSFEQPASRTTSEAVQQKQSVADVKTSTPRQASLANGQDPELQALLQSMEESARRARTGETSSRTAPEPKTAKEPEANENLPTIPVYKKTKVEIYRRVSDGSMQRVKR